jgi:hypothetical protein
VRRYSALATASVLAVGITGSVLAWSEIRSLDALTSTGYGQLFLVKLGAVALVAALGAYNHLRLVPALGEHVGSVQLVVAPARAGSNQIHLYTFDPDGRPVALADSLDLELELPAADLGPLARTATRAGPAHFQLNGGDLAVGGEWSITVRIRIDRFTEASGTVQIPIAG